MFFLFIFGGHSMDRQERVLRDLCIEIAKGKIRGDRFNELLLATGIFLDEHEWETANRLLAKSDQIQSSAPAELAMVE